jgi:hypothetical protein
MTLQKGIFMQYSITTNLKASYEAGLSTRLATIFSFYLLINGGHHGYIHPDDDGWFWISNSKLGEELPLIFLNDHGSLKSRQSIYQTLVQFEKKGLVETKTKYNRSGGKMRYTRITDEGLKFKNMK